MASQQQTTAATDMEETSRFGVYAVCFTRGRGSLRVTLDLKAEGQRSPQET